MEVYIQKLLEQLKKAINIHDYLSRKSNCAIPLDSVINYLILITSGDIIKEEKTIIFKDKDKVRNVINELFFELINLQEQGHLKYHHKKQFMELYNSWYIELVKSIKVI